MEPSLGRVQYLTCRDQGEVSRQRSMKKGIKTRIGGAAPEHWRGEEMAAEYQARGLGRVAWEGPARPR